MIVFVRLPLLDPCNNNKLSSVYDVFSVTNIDSSLQSRTTRVSPPLNHRCPSCAQAFNEYVDHPFDDVFYDCLHGGGLYTVGWMTTEGLARTFKRHVFARWSPHEIKNTATGIRNCDIDYFVGPSIEPEIVTVGLYTWYEIPTADHPYINFRGVPGTNLWVKVHNLSLIQFHTTYEGDNDGLRDVWRNIYTRMNDGTAETTLEDPVEAQAMREMRERDAG